MYIHNNFSTKTVHTYLPHLNCRLDTRCYSINTGTHSKKIQTLQEMNTNAMGKPMAETGIQGMPEGMVVSVFP